MSRDATKGRELEISPNDHEHDPYILLSETKRGIMNGEIRDLPRHSLEIPSPEENPSPKLSIKRKMKKETEALVNTMYNLKCELGNTVFHNFLTQLGMSCVLEI